MLYFLEALFSTIEFLLYRFCFFALSFNILQLNYYLIFNRKWLKNIFEFAECKISMFNSFFERFNFTDNFSSIKFDKENNNIKTTSNQQFLNLTNEIMKLANNDAEIKETNEKNKDLKKENELIITNDIKQESQLKENNLECTSKYNSMKILPKLNRKTLHKDFNNLNNMHKLLNNDNNLQSQITNFEESLKSLKND